MVLLDTKSVGDIKELVSLLTMLKAYKGWDGPNNIDRVCAALERKLDKACEKLLERLE